MSNKKLSINKETLRVLTADHALMVQGGIEATPASAPTDPVGCPGGETVNFCTVLTKGQGMCK